MTIISFTGNFGRPQAGCIPISPTRKPRDVRSHIHLQYAQVGEELHQRLPGAIPRKGILRWSENNHVMPHIYPSYPTCLIFFGCLIFNSFFETFNNWFFLVDLPQTPLLPPDPLLSPRHTKASWNTPPPAVSTVRTPRSGASSVVFGRRSGGWRVTRATKGAPLVAAQDQNSQQLQCACGMESWSWKTQVLVQ